MPTPLNFYKKNPYNATGALKVDAIFATDNSPKLLAFQGWLSDGAVVNSLNEALIAENIGVVDTEGLNVNLCNRFSYTIMSNTKYLDKVSLLVVKFAGYINPLRSNIIKGGFISFTSNGVSYGGYTGSAKNGYGYKIHGIPKNNEIFITNMVYSALDNTVTVTTDGDHDLITGDKIIISSVVPSTFNSTSTSGNIDVIKLSNTTFKYSVGVNPGVYSSGGKLLKLQKTLILSEAIRARTVVSYPAASAVLTLSVIDGQIVPNQLVTSSVPNTIAAGTTVVSYNTLTKQVTLSSPTLNSANNATLSFEVDSSNSSLAIPIGSVTENVSSTNVFSAQNVGGVEFFQRTSTPFNYYVPGDSRLKYFWSSYATPDFTLNFDGWSQNFLTGTGGVNGDKGDLRYIDGTSGSQVFMLYGNTLASASEDTFNNIDKILNLERGEGGDDYTPRLKSALLYISASNEQGSSGNRTDVSRGSETPGVTVKRVKNTLKANNGYWVGVIGGDLSETTAQRPNGNRIEPFAKDTPDAAKFVGINSPFQNPTIYRRLRSDARGFVPSVGTATTVKFGIEIDNENSFVYPSFTVVSSFNSGVSTINLLNVGGQELFVGRNIVGNGIDLDTTITNINGNTITLSKPTISNQTDSIISILGPSIDGDGMQYVELNYYHNFTYENNYTDLINLNVAINSTDTSLIVSDASSLRINSYIKIDNEYLGIVSIVNNTLTVQRGRLNSVPASHNSLSTVTAVPFCSIRIKDSTVETLNGIYRAHVLDSDLTTSKSFWITYNGIAIPNIILDPDFVSGYVVNLTMLASVPNTFYRRSTYNFTQPNGSINLPDNVGIGDKKEVLATVRVSETDGFLEKGTSTLRGKISLYTIPGIGFYSGLTSGLYYSYYNDVTFESNISVSQVAGSSSIITKIYNRGETKYSKGDILNTYLVFDQIKSTISAYTDETIREVSSSFISSDTTIPLDSDSLRFTVGRYAKIQSNGIFEIVKIVSETSTSVTVDRAQLGTLARDWDDTASVIQYATLTLNSETQINSPATANANFIPNRNTISLENASGVISIGQVVSGNGIDTDTTVVSYTATTQSLILSKPTIAVATAQSSYNINDTVITLTNINGSISVGQIVSGTGIDDDTVITDIDGNDITLSNPVITNETNTLLSFNTANVLLSFSSAILKNNIIRGKNIRGNSIVVDYSNNIVTVSDPFTGVPDGWTPADDFIYFGVVNLTKKVELLVNKRNNFKDISAVVSFPGYGYQNGDVLTPSPITNPFLNVNTASWQFDSEISPTGLIVSGDAAETPFSVVYTEREGITTGFGVGAKFTIIRDSNGSYRAILTSPGSGYVLGEQIVISGFDLGGISPDNDCTIFVGGVNDLSKVTMQTTTPHGFVPPSGRTTCNLLIKNVSPASYNGRYEATIIDEFTFTYLLSDDPGAYQSGGIVKNISIDVINDVFSFLNNKLFLNVTATKDLEYPYIRYAATASQLNNIATITTDENHHLTSTSATATFGSAVSTITLVNPVTTGIGSVKIGQGVSGAGIQLNTTVTAVNGNIITLSRPTASAQTSVTVLVGDRVNVGGISNTTRVSWNVSNAIVTVLNATQFTYPLPGGNVGLWISGGYFTDPRILPFGGVYTKNFDRMIFINISDDVVGGEPNAKTGLPSDNIIQPQKARDFLVRQLNFRQRSNDNDIVQSGDSHDFMVINSNTLAIGEATDVPINSVEWIGNKIKATTLRNGIISSITSVGTTVTVTMQSAHDLVIGTVVCVQGFNQEEYNGEFTILTTPTTTTFTYQTIIPPSLSPGTFSGFPTVSVKHHLSAGNKIDVNDFPQGNTYFESSSQEDTVLEIIDDYTFVYGQQEQSDGTFVGKDRLEPPVDTPFPLNTFVTIGTFTKNSNVFPEGVDEITVVDSIRSVPGLNEADDHYVVSYSGQGGQNNYTNFVLSLSKGGVSEIFQKTINNVEYNQTNNKATVFTSGPHTLSTGDVVTISGISPASYNGNYKVSTISSDSFSYSPPQIITFGSLPQQEGSTIYNLNGATTNATYTQSGNTITINSNGHGLPVGQRVYLDFTGAPTDGYYTVLTSAQNSFTVYRATSATITTTSVSFTRAYSLQSTTATTVISGKVVGGSVGSDLLSVGTTAASLNDVTLGQTVIDTTSNRIPVGTRVIEKLSITVGATTTYYMRLSNNIVNAIFDGAGADSQVNLVSNIKDSYSLALTSVSNLHIGQLITIDPNSSALASTAVITDINTTTNTIGLSSFYSPTLQTGTYSSASGICTVTSTSHGLSVGDKIYFDATSGTEPDGYVLITAAPTNANTFTFTTTNGTRSGNVTFYRIPNRITASSNVANSKSLKVNSVSNVVVGYSVTGSSIAPTTTVVSIDSVNNRVYLSERLTGTFSESSATSTFSIGDTTLTLSNIVGSIAVGKLVTGTGIPANTLVTSYNSSSSIITLSKEVTSNGTNVLLTFDDSVIFGVSDYVSGGLITPVFAPIVNGNVQRRGLYSNGKINVIPDKLGWDHIACARDSRGAIFFQLGFAKRMSGAAGSTTLTISAQAPYNETNIGSGILNGDFVYGEGIQGETRIVSTANDTITIDKPLLADVTNQNIGISRKDSVSIFPKYTVEFGRVLGKTFAEWLFKIA